MRVRRVRLGLAAVFFFGPLACGRSADRAPNQAAPKESATPISSAPQAASPCPANGLWAECSIIYRLDRSGLAPKLDSGATPNVKKLGGEPLMLRIGAIAKLELHIFPDSNARKVAALELDRAEYVTGTQMQTIQREKTLIESANLIGLLTSINSHQRERVSDALTAGPPQPPK